MLVSPKYLLGHFLVCVIVVSCFFLSFWQFSRLSERKELNKRVTARMSMPSKPLVDIMDPSSELDVEKNEYRQASMRGTYDPQGQVLISGRSRNDTAGYNVVTPLEIADTNSVVYINRGWIPQQLGDALLNGTATQEAIAPQGGYEKEREVVGLIRKNEAKQLLGDDKQVAQEKPTAVRISSDLFLTISGVDRNDLFSLWIQEKHEKVDGKNVTSTQSKESYPNVLDLPELTELNHFSYAVQWITFGVIAAITWVIVCKKALEKNRKKKPVST